MAGTRRSGAVPWLLGPLALGVLAGVAWWLAAPLGPWGGTPSPADLVGVPAGRDAVFALTQLACGLLCVAVLLARGGTSRPGRFLVLLAGSALGVAATLGTGLVLGRLAGPAAGEARVLGPLELRAVGFLAAWPLVVAAAVFVAAAWPRRETP